MDLGPFQGSGCGEAIGLPVRTRAEQSRRAGLLRRRHVGGSGGPSEAHSEEKGLAHPGEEQDPRRKVALPIDS